jgi:hypothetical protein
MANTRTVKRPVKTEPQTVWVDPRQDPEKANAEIAKVLAEVNTASMPEIDFPVDDTVNLPGGLILNNELIKNAVVKELTGEDEESLARASQSLNPFTFFDRLLKCGVVRLGAEPLSETEKILPKLLIGDREALILGVRRATYGDELEIEKWPCSNCGNIADLTMELSDIPVVNMDDPANESSFKVPLRKGGYALCRLANGADQLVIYDNKDITQAQRETVLLSRCVTTVVDAAGGEKSMAAFPSMAKSMSVVDRHNILNELKDRQPGPKYDKIKYTCESCNQDVFVVVTIGNLFRDFGWT